MSDLSGMTMGALRLRQMLGRLVVKKLCAEWRDEEGAAEALEKYKAQTMRITQEIRRRIRAEREAAGGELPPTQTVRMKPATLGAQAPQRRGIVRKVYQDRG